MTKQLQALKRKLEKMELEHLRQFIIEQATRIDELERDRDYWQDCAISADVRSDMFMQMVDDANYATHRCVGITRAGEMMVVAQ